MILLVAELQEQVKRLVFHITNKERVVTLFEQEKANVPLPGDVEVHHLTLLVLHGDGCGTTAAATAEQRKATINQPHAYQNNSTMHLLYLYN